MDLNYKPPGAVIRDFMRSDTFFRGIRGPVGSGKSVSCCIEILRRSIEQAPSPDGKRRSRWAVIRNTNPQLKTTTIKTWLEWVKESAFGRFTWSVPYTHQLRFGDVEAEVIFLALDVPEDVQKLLSLDLTGVWVNEAREVPKAIIDGCTMRCGRYPSMAHGGPSWYGIICDTNAPERDHWWPIMAGDTSPPDYMSEEEKNMLLKPENWEFFTQPPAMIEEMDQHGIVHGYKKNPKAENMKNLVPDYYSNLMSGKTKSWIDVYVMNRLGSVESGKRVYPMFRQEAHVAKEPIRPMDNQPIWVGLDFGLTPAAVWAQCTSRGQWRILHETVTQDMGITRFAELLHREARREFPNHADFRWWGDPTGDNRDQDENIAFQILDAHSIMANAAPTNDPSLRIDTVSELLNRMVDGEPGLIVSPTCTTLITGFTSGYMYRRLQVRGEFYEEKPHKNQFSHPHDALQYLVLGAGEGDKLMARRGGQPSMVTQARTDWSVWDRRSGFQKKRRRRPGGALSGS